MIRTTIATALLMTLLGCSGAVSSFKEKLSGDQGSSDATAADATTTPTSGDAAGNGSGAGPDAASGAAADGGSPAPEAGVTVALETTPGADDSAQPSAVATASPSPSASPKPTCKKEHGENDERDHNDKDGHALAAKDERTGGTKYDKDDCDKDDKDDKDHYDKEDVDDKGECARNLGVKFERLRLSGKGSEKVFDLKEGDGYVAKATGSKTEMVLNIAARKDAAKLKALCLIAGGNQVQILVDTAASIEAIHFIGRGNMATGHVNVQKGAEVSKVTSSLKGTGASFKIEGDGKYPK